MVNVQPFEMHFSRRSINCYKISLIVWEECQFSDCLNKLLNYAIQIFCISINLMAAWFSNYGERKDKILGRVVNPFIFLWNCLKFCFASNCGMWTRFGPLLVLVNKALLEHSHVLLLMCYLWLLSYYYCEDKLR